MVWLVDSTRRCYSSAQLLPRVIVTINDIYKRIEGLAGGIKDGNVATELASFVRDALSTATLSGLDDVSELLGTLCIGRATILMT